MLHIIVQTLKMVTIAAMALLVVAGGARFFSFAVERTTPDDAGKTFRVRITENDTPDKIADELVEAGLIRSKLLFTTQLRASAIVSGRALELKPGEHIIRKGMSVDQIIARVTGAVVETEAEVAEADASSGETFQITIPEGWRIEQIADEYEALGGEGGARAFIKAVNEVDRSRYDFLADVPPNASLEGFLFPDTYVFYRDDPAYDVDLMLLNFGRKVSPEMRQRAEEMQLGLRQVLTLASLVEREAQVDTERPIIADVYLSRLEQGWNLEADPTMQYALGPRDGEWWFELSAADLEILDPYNTYKNGGLPPGPICNPGLASIQSVLTPDETDYMFFVAKGDGSGEHAFAVTAEEQQANIDAFREAPQGGGTGG